MFVISAKWAAKHAFTSEFVDSNGAVKRKKKRDTAHKTESNATSSRRRRSHEKPKTTHKPTHNDDEHDDAVINVDSIPRAYSVTRLSELRRAYRIENGLSVDDTNEDDVDSDLESSSDVILFVCLFVFFFF